MMFEIYKEEVDIKGTKYELRPLNGRFLPKLYAIMGKFNDMKEEEGSFPLDEEATAKLHEIAFQTFKKSYPNKSDEELDEFVSQNLLLLIEPLIKVNIGEQPKKE